MKKLLSIAIALPFVLVSLAGCTSDLSADESKETSTSTTEISTESSDFSYDYSEEYSSEEEKIEEEEKAEKEKKEAKSSEEEDKQKQDQEKQDQNKVNEEKKEEKVAKQENSSKENEQSKKETDSSSSTQNKTSLRIETESEEKTTTTAPRQSTTSPSSGSSSSNSSSPSSIEMEVVNLVNKERTARGLQPLKVDSAVANVAAKKSLDMKNNNYFSHQSPTYGSPFQMLKQFGVSYRSAGENIAAGQRTAEQVMNSWMNSSGHRANILNPSFTHIGVGFVQGGAYGTYWTQIFIQK